MWKTVASSSRRLRVYTAAAGGGGVVAGGSGGVESIRVTLASADFEIAWDPYGRESPTSNTWVFATPSTPRFIARELTGLAEDGETRVVAIHSKSLASEKALEEMAAAIVSAGADADKVVAIVGGTLTEAAAAIVAKTSEIFAAAATATVAMTVMPGVNETTREFEAIENVFAIAPRKTAAAPPIDRVRTHAATFWDAAAPARLETLTETSFSSAAFEVAAAMETSARMIATSAVSAIIMTGLPGPPFDDAAARIATACAKADRAVHVVGEAEAIRLRARIPAAVESFRARVATRTLVIIATPNPRASDRESFVSLTSEASPTTPSKAAAAVIAWVTRPSQWLNSRTSKSPILAASIRAAAAAFQPPEGEAAAVVRAV